RRLGLPQAPPLTKGETNVCILVTRFYPTGGHSKVAADIARLAGASRVTVIFTDIYGQLRQDHMIAKESPQGDTFQRRANVLLTAPTLVEKIIQLHQILAAMQPSRIFLLANH